MVLITVGVGGSRHEEDPAVVVDGCGVRVSMSDNNLNFSLNSLYYFLILLAGVVDLVFRG